MIIHQHDFPFCLGPRIRIVDVMLYFIRGKSFASLSKVSNDFEVIAREFWPENCPRSSNSRTRHIFTPTWAWCLRCNPHLCGGFKAAWRSGCVLVHWRRVPDGDYLGFWGGGGGGADARMGSGTGELANDELALGFLFLGFEASPSDSRFRGPI